MNEVRDTIKEMKDYTYRMLISLTDEVGATSMVVESLYKRLRSAGASGDSTREMLAGFCKTLIDKERDIIDIVEESFRNAVVKETLDYKQLNIIHYINAIGYCNRYMRAYVSAVVGFERERAGKDVSKLHKLSMAFVSDVDNLNTFIACYEALRNPTGDFYKSLEKLQGIQVDPDLDERSMGLRSGATDPLKLGFLPPSLNPVFYAGLVVNQWKAYSYEQAKYEYEQLELEVISLRRSQDGLEPDPAIEKQIDYYMSRITKLEVKIKKIEDGAR